MRLVSHWFWAQVTDPVLIYKVESNQERHLAATSFLHTCADQYTLTAVNNNRKNLLNDG